MGKADQRKGWNFSWSDLLLPALVILAGVESTATVWQHEVTPSDSDWRSAIEYVSQQRDVASEPLLFAPSWIEPLGRLYAGPALNLSMMTLSDIEKFKRVWLVSIRDTTHHWLLAKKPVSSKRFGLVDVRLYQQNPTKILTDFRAELSAATVTLSGEKKVTCPHQAGRFSCSRTRSWNWVGLHVAEVGHRPYGCIYAHPVDRHTLTISFPDVRVGSQLAIYTGIDDFENRKLSKTPVRMRVRANNNELAAILHGNGDDWRRTVIDTTHLDSEIATVTFEVSTSRAYARAFCFHAEARQ